MIVSHTSLFLLCVASFMLGGSIIGYGVYIYDIIRNNHLIKRSRKAIDEALEIRKHIDSLNKIHESFVKDKNDVVLEFTGTTSIVNMCAINMASFKLSNGETIYIDRDTTEFSCDRDGSFSMIWRNCYIWNSSLGAIYLDPEKDLELIKGSKLICMEVEDEAPENYNVHVDIWGCY